MNLKYLSAILVSFLFILLISCAAPIATYTTPIASTAPTTIYTPSPTPSTAPTATYTPTPTPSATLKIPTIVTRVIDGDTIEVNIAGTIYRIRYIGIDAPELNDKRPEFNVLAQEATSYNRQLVEGKIVTLEKDVSETDKYGRLLRYVHVDNILVNGEVIRQGLAWAIVYEPDTKYRDYLENLEKEAKQSSRGIWAVTKSPNVQITYIFYNGAVPRVESDEYVEITNLGEQSQDLAGWILKDISEDHLSFIFSSYILAPGKSIRVYTNELHPEWGGFSFKYNKAIWNNTKPDVAVLYNSSGKEVSRKSY